MANIPVVTSPKGVWPAETVSVDEVVVAQVEAAVLRRPIGELHEQRQAIVDLDMIEKSTHEAPVISAEPDPQAATEGDDNVAFAVTFSGDPVPEVRWYGIQDGVSTLYVDNNGDVEIVTTDTTSSLTLDNIAVGQDATTVRVEVRNYKGAAAAEAELTVAEHAVPAITSLTPDNGAAAGGTAIALVGTALDGATGVTFGGTPGTGFVVNSPTSISITSPAHAAGAVDVVVQSPYGDSAAETYTYA